MEIISFVCFVASFIQSKYMYINQINYGFFVLLVVATNVFGFLGLKGKRKHLAFFCILASLLLITLDFIAAANGLTHSRNIWEHYKVIL